MRFRVADRQQTELKTTGRRRMFPRHHETWELLVSVFDSTGKLFDFWWPQLSPRRGVVLEPCLLWCCVED